MKFVKNQTVNYVAPPAKAGGKPVIRQGVIVEAMGDKHARIDHSAKEDGPGQHLAIATFNEDNSIENTFTLADAPEASNNGAKPSRPGNGRTDHINPEKS